MVGAIWRYRRCPNCGRSVLSKSQDAYNSPCNKCVKLRTSPAKKPAIFNMQDPDNYIIVKDPLPYEEGGFSKGAAITRIQAECMLNVGSFTDGTIVRDRDNNQYQALRDFTGKQQLIRL